MVASTRRKVVRALTELMNANKAPEALTQTPPERLVGMTIDFVKWQVGQGYSEDELFTHLFVNTTYDEWKEQLGYLLDDDTSAEKAVAEKKTVAEKKAVAEKTVVDHSKSKVTKQRGKQTAATRLTRPVPACEFSQYWERKQQKAGKDTQNAAAPRSSRPIATHQQSKQQKTGKYIQNAAAPGSSKPIATQQQSKQQKTGKDIRNVAAPGPLTEKIHQQALEQVSKMITDTTRSNYKDLVVSMESLNLGEDDQKKFLRILTSAACSDHKRFLQKDIGQDLKDIKSALERKYEEETKHKAAGLASRDGTDAAEFSNHKQCRQEEAGQGTQDATTAEPSKVNECTQQAAGQAPENITVAESSKTVPEPVLIHDPDKRLQAELDSFRVGFQ
jgi:hypothetical protein